MGDGARKLKATVHLDGEVYEAGTKVPAEVAARITNPKAWGKDSTPSGDAPDPAADTSDDGPKGTDAEVIPPLTGKGSSVDAWRAYANAAALARGLNIEIPEDAKRGDIVEALEAAGVPTAPEEE